MNAVIQAKTCYIGSFPRGQRSSAIQDSQHVGMVSAGFKKSIMSTENSKQYISVTRSWLDFTNVPMYGLFVVAAKKEDAKISKSGCTSHQTWQFCCPASNNTFSAQAGMSTKPKEQRSSACGQKVCRAK